MTPGAGSKGLTARSQKSSGSLGHLEQFPGIRKHVDSRGVITTWSRPWLFLAAFTLMLGLVSAACGEKEVIKEVCDGVNSLKVLLSPALPIG